MEQGYSFVWPADGRPYFIRPDMGVIELNVDGRVPVIDSSLSCFEQWTVQERRKIMICCVSLQWLLQRQKVPRMKV